MKFVAKLKKANMLRQVQDQKPKADNKKFTK